MSKPKLVFVIPHIGSGGGGVSESLRLLVDALFRRDVFDIHVLTMASFHDVNAVSSWPGVRIHFCRSFAVGRYEISFGILWHMFVNRYHLVHVHGIWTFHVLAAAVGILKGIPVVTSIHGMLEPWIRARSPVKKRIVSRLYQDYVLKRSKYLHVLNEKEALDVRDAYPDTRIVTIPNFVEPFVGNEGYPKWMNPNLIGKKVFLFFGRIHDKKGWRELLSAWTRLCLDSPAVQSQAVLVYCGWNDGVDGFDQAIVAAQTATGAVVYAGPQFGQDRVKSYNAADFFILPSKSEGLPMAVLEAVQGKAVVLMSRYCNLNEMIDCGAAIDTGVDVETVEKSLRLAIELDREQRANITKRAADYVACRYSEDTVSSSFVRLYMNMIS